MTRIYVDATTLIDLGTIGELERVRVFDGPLRIPPAIQREVTTEPARTNLERLLDGERVNVTTPATEGDIKRALGTLGESEANGDVQVIAAVLAHVAADESVAVVSDDRRVRTVARGLGASVTGTIGVIVRAVEDGLPEDEAKRLLRRVDEHGLHLTGELRDHADGLIESATD